MRKKIYCVVEKYTERDKANIAYDIFMMITIVASIFPLFFKQQYKAFVYIDYITASIFIVDYILRFITADYKLKKGKLSFLLFPITPLAIIDLISILPTFLGIAKTFRVLKVVRLLRTFRVFRAFKFIRYSRSIRIITTVLKRQTKPLLIVALFSLGYIIISALLIFNVEPDTFENFFSAIYWATISLTTVGYGDIYAVSQTGRIVTMLSSVVGIAIIALPSGIITAGFMTELHDRYTKEKKNENKKEKTAEQNSEPDENEPKAAEENELETPDENELETPNEKEKFIALFEENPEKENPETLDEKKE